MNSTSTTDALLKVAVMRREQAQERLVKALIEIDTITARIAVLLDRR